MVEETVRQGSPVRARLLSHSVDCKVEESGEGGIGGIWPSINETLIWALAQVDGKMAWDEWKKNTLAAHSETYPDIWYGIWSGPDTYNSPLSKYPGQTGFDERFVSDNPPEGWFGQARQLPDYATPAGSGSPAADPPGCQRV